MKSPLSAVTDSANATRPRWPHLLLLFFSVFFIYNANLRGLSSGDCVPARLLPFSLLREGNLSLDEFHLRGTFSAADPSQPPYFVIEKHGHLFSQYPVALPIIITPLYLPVVALLDSAVPISMDNTLAKAMEKLSASLIATLSVIFVYLALRELCAARPALWLAFLYAFGTNTWTISSQALWQHGLSELSLSLMVYAFLKSPQREMWLVLAGLGAALATANRPPNIVFSCLALLYVWRYHRHHVRHFLLFPGLIGSLFLIYNVTTFGTLVGGYGRIVPLTDPSSWLNPFNLEGLLGTLLSPSRGLFIYTPLTLFSIWGCLRLWLRPASALLKYMSLGVVSQVFFYSSFSMWWAGHSFGPRFLTDIAPFFCFFLVPLLPTLRYRVVQIPFLVAVLLSLSVQMTDAFFYPAGSWDATPVSLSQQPERLWDWQDTQIRRSLQHGLVLPYSRLLPQFLVGAQEQATDKTAPAAQN